MPTAVWILFGIAIGGIAAFFILVRNRKEEPEKPNEGLLILQNQMNELKRELSGKLDLSLGQSTNMLQKQHSESLRTARELTEKLTKLDETNKQVVNFAVQLDKLQDILKNPKQRGVFGEYFLETLLKNAFTPKDYQMQYKFRDGEIVDAVLYFGDKIIPIDSKFSLENYNRLVDESNSDYRTELETQFKNDLKKRIEETSKYIRPTEGTTDFAFMFIPAEGIYYDLLVNKVGAVKSNTRDLIDYAINEKKVHIVSPTTFYVTLQAMIVGMRTYQIQESTKEILKNVGQLEKHLKAFAEYHSKLGAHLNTTVNAYNSSAKELNKIDKDVLKLGGEGMNLDLPAANKTLSQDELTLV